MLSFKPILPCRHSHANATMAFKGGPKRGMMIRQLKSIVACILSVSLVSGCATSTVLGRPPAKNLSALSVGTSRGLVLAELGAPAYSKETDGEKVDTFSFDKGVSGGFKFGRGFFHVAADLFTLFLWELVAWPAEKIAAGPNTKVEITYDRSEKVKTVNYLALK